MYMRYCLENKTQKSNNILGISIKSGISDQNQEELAFWIMLSCEYSYGFGDSLS